GAGPGPIGLDEEIDAAREGLSAVPWVRWSEEGRRRWRSVRRRLARAGGWMEPEDLRDRLRPRLLEIARSGFPAEPPPDRSEGLEVLPLFYDPALGCLAITDHPGGVELLVLREDGGDPVPAGAWAVPDRSPDCDADADRTLRGYLDYLLARDFTYWAAAARAGDDDRLIDLVEEDLGRFGALVLARAWVRRAMTHPTRGRLDASAILDGIRATDAEFLDRPTLGRIL
ncbi:MAG TPA: hypothetical protein VMH90_06820, partial [Thermoplasmata archaeon]|nr:hypothetical protein [Thermoplasmata archaeon]